MLGIIPEKYHAKCEFLLETGIHANDYSGETLTRQTDRIIRVLYVGRITPYKGLEFLIRAVAKLPKDILKKISLEIVGAGEKGYETRCRRLVSDLRIEKETIFLGPLRKEEVHDHYRRADIFAFPTLAETSGNVILEAMAMGLPVISTNYGGPSEIIDAGSGVLIDPDSPEQFIEEMCQALEILIRDKSVRQKIGAKARDRALGDFAWSKKGALIQKIYERLVGTNSN
jgi:glycosyltransferase involved in cell wall biosynthesis